MAKITKHAGKRVKERTGVGKSEDKIQRLAEKALERGYTHAQTKGNLRKILDKHFLSHKTANNMRVYGGNLYIFRNRTLITVIPLPSNIINHINDYIIKDQNS